ncbi:MAG TPA: GAF domain-containing protein, partial [Anaerolineales bacterium]|nr:GAF domain-containing protein [Anaerolineales bacterium]
LDPDDILKRTIHLSCQVLNGLVGQAFIYDPQEQRLILRAVYGEEQRRQNALLIHHTQRPWIGLTGWVAEHHKAVYVPDVSTDERWVHVSGIDDEVRSALFAPIIFDDQLLGVISVYHRLKDAFSNDYLDLIQAICQQVGLALSNARRYQQTQQRLSEIMFIQSMSQTFNKRLSKRELLEEVVTQLIIQGNYSDARIYLAEGAHLTLAAARGSYPSTRESRFCRQLAEQALAQGTGILISDLPQQTAGEEIDTDSASLLTLPIFRENSAIGALQVAGELPNQITTHDREVLALLCGQISVALENAILYDHIRSHADELERIVAQKTSELTALYRLSQEIGYQISFDELLSLVLEHLYNAISGDVVAGCLLVERSGALIISAARPLSDQAMAQIRSAYEHMLHESGAGVETLPKVILRPVESYCEPCPVIAKLNSMIVAPVFLDNKMAGTLIVASEQKHFLGAEEMRLLTTFANQAATAAHRLHALLMAQQQHLEDLFTHMPVGVLLVDENRVLLSSNPRGRSNLSDINGDAGAASLERLGTLTFEELIAHQDDSLPFTVNTNEPTLRTFEVQVRPVGAKDSRQWVITLREVTQEREYQERIQSQERLATVGQLAAGIAHDFNNIMAAILVYADLLRYDASLPAASRDKVTIIQQQVQRAASLIRQILDFSRRSVMEQSRLNLLPFIKELDKLLGRVLPETIELQLHYQPGVYYINADPTRLQQVFMNLALNARDAMPNGGVLRFELGRIYIANAAEAPVPDMPPGEWIRVQVKDTGHGIQQSVRAHIFEPFYTTKPVGQGTGLGLAQVYGIIKQHDGFVDVQSRPDQGATFILYFPALEFGKTGELPPLEDELNMGSGERILVVEDDVSTRQAIQALLEAHNYRVLTAADGQVALDLLTAEGAEIALVISDLVMPRMGGVDLYRALKAQNWQGKILFITGHPLEGDYQHLLEKGEVEWLNKPFSVQALTHAVRQQLLR